MRVSRAGDGVLAIAVWSNFDDPSALLQGTRWFWHHAANKMGGETESIHRLGDRDNVPATDMKIGTFSSLVACTTRLELPLCCHRCLPYLGAGHISRSRLCLGFRHCHADHRDVGRDRIGFSLFGHLAINHQYGHDRRHFPDGVLNPKHSEPRCESYAVETRRNHSRSQWGEKRVDEPRKTIR